MTLHDNTNITTVVPHYSADVSKYLIQHAQCIRRNFLSSLYQVSDRDKEKKPLQRLYHTIVIPILIINVRYCGRGEREHAEVKGRRGRLTERGGCTKFKRMRSYRSPTYLRDRRSKVHVRTSILVLEGKRTEGANRGRGKGRERSSGIGGGRDSE